MRKKQKIQKNVALPEDLLAKMKEYQDKWDRDYTDQWIIEIALYYFCYSDDEEKHRIIALYYDPKWPGASIRSTGDGNNQQ